MGLPSDYHMHTPLCHHATGWPTDYAAHAAKIGLAEIGITDHSPMPRDDFDDWRMALSDLDQYVQSVEKARRDHPSIHILLGLEVDFIPGLESFIRDLASRHPWDYFIGSVHYVSGSWDLDNPKKISEWKRRDPFEVWSAYFDRLTLATQSGLFDIIGHADLCKKFCFYPKEDCSPLHERFLDAARDHDVAIELNTSGLRKDCREMYPAKPILEGAARRGIPLTFGSDAHAPHEVGMDFQTALNLAKSCGFTQRSIFRRRKRDSVPID